MSEITIGVDWAQKDGDKTCVIFARRECDGSVVVLAELHGEAAEYVAQLESENGALVEENQKWRKLINKYKLGILATHDSHSIDVDALLTAEESECVYCGFDYRCPIHRRPR